MRRAVDEAAAPSPPPYVTNWRPSLVCVVTVSLPYSSTSRITVVCWPLTICVCTVRLRPKPPPPLLLKLVDTNVPPPKPPDDMNLDNEYEGGGQQIK